MWKSRITALFIGCCLLNGRAVMADVKNIKKSISRGQTVSMDIATAPGLGTVIILPDIPEKVGAGDTTHFHVEVYGETLMVKPKTAVVGVKTNLFALLPGDTVLTFKVKSATPAEGEDVVEISWSGTEPDRQPRPRQTNSSSATRISENLLGKSEFKRASGSGRSGEIRIVVRGAAHLGNRTYLKFVIKNRGSRSFEISSAELTLQTLGGISGRTVKGEIPLEAETAFTATLVEPKREVVGVIGFQGLEPAHNQRLLLKVYEAGDRGRVIRVANVGVSP